MLSGLEVAKHNSRTSCWVIIDGNAYDVTAFLDDHPGGAAVILRYGGKDATKEYEPLHPPGTIEQNLPSDKHLGPVDPSTITLIPQATDEHVELQQNTGIPLRLCQNLDEIESEAKRKLSRKAWVYFNSAADSLSSLYTNRHDWSKISFRPRVLRNVARVSMKRRVLGLDSDLPFFIAPAALAKLGHEEGELCLSRGAAQKNICYCVSTYSSIAHEEIAESFQEGGNNRGSLAFQLYVPKKKEDARQLIAKAKSLKCSALVITIDTPVVGKREEDERYKAEIELQEGQEVPRTSDPSPGVEAPILRGHHSSTVDWDDIEWMRKEWDSKLGPVIIKGITTPEDALIAVRSGVDGIYLSNHGGRQLDFAPSSIRALLEIRKFCPEVLTQVEVYLDGGVRRGTDIVKALCLGATGVGLGRPFMYALSAYGTEGVLKAIQLLSEEIETTMRLLGVTALEQLNPNYLNTTVLEQELPHQIQLDADARQYKL